MFLFRYSECIEITIIPGIFQIVISLEEKKHKKVPPNRLWEQIEWQIAPPTADKRLDWICKIMPVSSSNKHSLGLLMNLIQDHLKASSKLPTHGSLQNSSCKSNNKKPQQNSKNQQKHQPTDRSSNPPWDLERDCQTVFSVLFSSLLAHAVRGNEVAE